METKHVNHECPALPNISVNSNLTNDLVLTPSMASTRALLEDVCNDFENINVIAPKDNKFVYIKKWNLPGEYSQFTTEACNLMENIVSKESQNQNFTGIVKTVDGSSLTTSVILPPAELQNQNCDGITNSVENARTEMVSLQDSSNKSVVPDTLAKDENLSSSLAELADAEIVRTGENAVSIIISNPRFIQVVTSANNSDIPSNISDLALNSNSIISEKESLTEVIVESTPVSEYSVQETNINKNNQGAPNTIIYAHNLEEDVSQRVNLPKYMSTPNTFVSKERNKMYVRSRAELGPDFIFLGLLGLWFFEGLEG
ncbi:uncharacterized protein CEXT_451431 [Caerostris extrusa]|uniref:Uncharacterized protein n=1 Tax=Caerostris extrusa TaxID=172846 RepID=A0AAV4Y6F9_CAEEX|nr:uncharacterized protein CEXT_451431 [Caerostris extrusa]